MGELANVIERNHEMLEYDFMTKLDCSFVTKEQIASLDMLLQMSVTALHKITQGMTFREKNIVANMFIANLNNATCFDCKE